MQESGAADIALNAEVHDAAARTDAVPRWPRGLFDLFEMIPASPGRDAGAHGYFILE
jgi:hypothetical protein